MTLIRGAPWVSQDHSWTGSLLEGRIIGSVLWLSLHALLLKFSRCVTNSTLKAIDFGLSMFLKPYRDYEVSNSESCGWYIKLCKRIGDLVAGPRIQFLSNGYAIYHIDFWGYLYLGGGSYMHWARSISGNDLVFTTQSLRLCDNFTLVLLYRCTCSHLPSSC